MLGRSLDIMILTVGYSVYLIKMFTSGVTVQQGMLSHPGHLVPPLVFPGVRVYPALNFGTIYEIYHSSLSSLFIHMRTGDDGQMSPGGFR